MNEEIKEEVIINLHLTKDGNSIKSKVKGSVQASSFFLMAAIIESQKLIYHFYEKRNELELNKGGENGD